MTKKRRKNRKNKRKWKSTRMYDNLGYEVGGHQKNLDFGDGNNTYHIDSGCNKEFTKAFAIGDLTFWGGPESDIDRTCWDVVISLREFNKKFLVTSIYTKKFSKIIKFISIPCPNNEAPTLNRTAWQELIQELPEKGDVAVCCFGGRGRTGTALAILRSLLTNDGNDPIQAIRDLYNQRAVESEMQVRYVERITNVKSVCEGSNEYYFYGSYGNYDGYYPVDDWYYSAWSGRESTMEEKLRNRLLGLADAKTY